MTIELLALDIDGTLLDSQYRISDANRRAISQAIDHGARVVLVTGRRFVIARPVAFELELNTPLITHNGALTKNASTLEILGHLPLPASLARRVVELGREAEVDLVCCYDPEGYGQAVIDSVSKENLKLRRYLDRDPMVLKQVPDLWAYITEDPIQVMSAGRCARMGRFERVLVDQMNGHVKLLKTVYPDQDLTILDILTSECSKARALSTVAQSYGLTRQQIMAIGDNHNDLEMLQFAGIGVLMGNADRELKKLGYHITGTHDEDGVAQAIEEFILNPSSRWIE